jgi:hypothetical protein
MKQFGNQETAKKYFKEVIDVLEFLEGNGYQCAIDSGTLLGYTREKQVITHDHDYDVVAFIEGDALFEITRNYLKLINKLEEKENYFPIRGSGMHIQLRRTFGIDIFLGFIYRDLVYIYPHIKGIKKEDYFPIKKVNMYGYKVPIPSNPELFCEKVYGKNWQEPDPDWKFDWDLKNPILKEIRRLF